MHQTKIGLTPATYRLRSALYLTVLLAIGWLLPMTKASALDSERLNALKVAYVYNFTKFVQWPKAGDTELRLCLNINNPSLKSEFNKLQQKGLSVVSLQESNVEQLAIWQRCQIIYFDDPFKLTKKPHQLQQSILTISESMDDDAQIHFIVIDNKLRFSIGKSLAEKAGLKISSKLLRLAHEVY